MKRHQKRMRHQLTVYFVVVAVISLSLFVSYYFFVMRQNIERETLEKSDRVLRHALEKIELQAEQVNEFANYICRNQNVQLLLLQNSQNAEQFSEQKQNVIDEVNRQFQNLPLAEDILSLFIIGNNDLDIRFGKEASLVEYGAVKDFFCEMERFSDTSRIRWDALHENFTTLSNYDTVLPYSQRIVGDDGSETLGYLVVLFKDSLFANQCPEFLGEPGERIALLTDQGQMLGANDAWLSDSDLISRATCSWLFKTGKAEGFKMTAGGKTLVLYSDATAVPVWILIAAVPVKSGGIDLLLLFRAAVPILLISLAVAYGLAFYFSMRFTKPITEMVSAVSDIARGNFERQIVRCDPYELTQLGNGINEMQREIKLLIEQRILREKKERDAEMRMLKAQINPHFLNNTLNSIRMMAKMQGARGIAKMTEALGDLLRASLSSPEETISLHDELEMLSKYIYIQNVRYKGLIEYEIHISDDELYNFRILRFILQPLVENSILHGIKPSSEGVKITVSAWREQNILYLCVEDNGQGISEEKLHMLRNGTSQHSREIGVQNVHRRLQMVYGEQSGLHFESESGKRTKVTAVLHLKVETMQGGTGT